MTNLPQLLTVNPGSDGGSVLAWLGAVGGISGGAAGIAAFVVALVVRRDTKTQIKEAPARAQQQARLTDVTRELADLVPALTIANRASQERYKLKEAADDLRGAAETIKRSVTSIRELTIPALDNAVAELGRVSVDPQNDMPGMAGQLEQLAGLLEALQVARPSPAREVTEGSIHQHEELIRQISRITESARLGIYKSEVAAATIRDRVRTLEAKGLGELPKD